MISIGQKFGNLQVGRLDDTSKRAIVTCACGTVLEVSVTALLQGVVSSCGCKPVTKKREAAVEAEHRTTKRSKYFQDWRLERGR